MTTVEQSRAWRSIVDVWQDVCWDLRDRDVPFPKDVHSCLLDLERAVHNGTDINAAVDAVEKAAREAGIWTRPNGPTAHLKDGQTYVVCPTQFAVAVNALRVVTPKPTAAHAVRVPSDSAHLNLALELGEARDQRDVALRQRDEAQQLAQDFERRADDNAAELNDIKCIAARMLGCEVPQTGANSALELVRRLAAELAQVRDQRDEALDGRDPETGRHDAYLCEKRKRKDLAAEIAQVQAAALQALGRTVPQIGANPTLTVVNDLIIALRAERARNRSTACTAPEVKVNGTRDPYRPSWDRAREAWRAMFAAYRETPPQRRNDDLCFAIHSVEAFIFRGEKGWVDAAEDAHDAIGRTENAAKAAGLWAIPDPAFPGVLAEAITTNFAQSILALRAATPRE